MTARTPNNIKRKDGIHGTEQKQFVICGGSCWDSLHCICYQNVCRSVHLSAFHPHEWVTPIRFKIFKCFYSIQ